jgi:hypothetical protein
MCFSFARYGVRNSKKMCQFVQKTCGKIIFPSSVLSINPAFSKVCTSVCTPLISRPSLRATSRKAIAPTPVITSKIAQRFGARVCQSSTLLSKLRYAACAVNYRGCPHSLLIYRNNNLRSYKPHPRIRMLPS